MAHQYGLNVGKNEVSKEDGFKNAGASAPPGFDARTMGGTQVPESIIEQHRQSVKQEGEAWVNTVLTQLKPGEIHPKVIDSGEAWL